MVQGTGAFPYQFHNPDIVQANRVGLYGAAVTIIDLHVFEFRFHIDHTFFSLLGIMLSLLLVFRTNSSYDRFWEGRKQWGTLVNDSRNLAVMMDSLLPAVDLTTRQYFARSLANFAHALKGHLRTGINGDDLLETADGPPAALLTDSQYFHSYNKAALQLNTNTNANLFPSAQ